MNDELARNVMNLNKSENAKKNLEAKLAQYEERMRAYDGQVSNELKFLLHVLLDFYP